MPPKKAQSSLTLQQLRQQAKPLNIPYYYRLRKAKLIAALVEHRKSNKSKNMLSSSLASSSRKRKRTPECSWKNHEQEEKVAKRQVQQLLDDKDTADILKEILTCESINRILKLFDSTRNQEVVTFLGAGKHGIVLLLRPTKPDASSSSSSSTRSKIKAAPPRHTVLKIYRKRSDPKEAKMQGEFAKIDLAPQILFNEHLDTEQLQRILSLQAKTRQQSDKVDYVKRTGLSLELLGMEAMDTTLDKFLHMYRISTADLKLAINKVFDMVNTAWREKLIHDDVHFNNIGMDLPKTESQSRKRQRNDWEERDNTVCFESPPSLRNATFKFLDFGTSRQYRKTDKLMLPLADHLQILRNTSYDPKVGRQLCSNEWNSNSNKNRKQLEEGIRSNWSRARKMVIAKLEKLYPDIDYFDNEDKVDEIWHNLEDEDLREH